MLTAILIILGSIVGGLAALGLIVLVRVVAVMRGQSVEQHQARLNAAQARIVAQQVMLAAKKRELKAITCRNDPYRLCVGCAPGDCEYQPPKV